MTILVPGSAGFIGANFVLDWIANGDEPVFNLDKPTYAGKLFCGRVSCSPLYSNCSA